MTSLSQYLLVKKLSELNPGQESVETLSLWMLHHRKHATTIVKYWAERFITVSQTRKMAFIFLANEIISASENKSLQFRKEFEKVLPDIFRHVGETSTSSQLLEQIHRILDIWRTRGLFNTKSIYKFWANLNGTESWETTEEEDDYIGEEPQSIKKLLLSLTAPDEKTLIRTITSLEDAPSVDVQARADISKLPKKLFEMNTIEELKNSHEANEFAIKLDNAMDIVEDYNERLELEVVQREKLSNMLDSFKQAELERVAEIERKMEQLEERMNTVWKIRKDLKLHRASLPDLACCPNVEELPPLPSVEDLFKK